MPRCRESHGQSSGLEFSTSGSRLIAAGQEETRLRRRARANAPVPSWAEELGLASAFDVAVISGRDWRLLPARFAPRSWGSRPPSWSVTAFWRHVPELAEHPDQGIARARPCLQGGEGGRDGDHARRGGARFAAPRGSSRTARRRSSRADRRHRHAVQEEQIEWIKGSAWLLGKGVIEVTDAVAKSQISAGKEIIVATGSSPRGVPASPSMIRAPSPAPRRRPAPAPSHHRDGSGAVGVVRVDLQQLSCSGDVRPSSCCLRIVPNEDAVVSETLEKQLPARRKIVRRPRRRRTAATNKATRSRLTATANGDGRDAVGRSTCWWRSAVAR